MLNRSEPRQLTLGTESLDKLDPSADLTKFKSPSVLSRKKNTKRRAILDQRRTETAAIAIESLDHEIEIHGFTKGQFSIIDLILATLDKIGPADLIISTWTAARADISTTMDMIQSGRILSSRWLVDVSLQRRQPELAQRIREAFGPDSIRVAKNHAKFYLLSNADWKVVIKTSMNLNFNPRFEDFTISDDPELYDFHATIIDEIWTKQKASVAFDRPYAIEQQWDRDN